MTSLIVLLGKPVARDSAKIQMILRRIHPPLQHREEERAERGQRSKSSEHLPEAPRQ